jgi:mRNA interferase MazF
MSDTGSEVLQWSLFYATLDPALGSEQAGKRPALIVSSDSTNEVLSVVTVIPLTSKRPGRKVYSTEALLPADSAGQQFDSIAMAHQVRTISKDRLGSYIGKLDDPDLKEDVRQALRIHFDI